jgi:hypothetical protein
MGARRDPRLGLNPYLIFRGNWEDQVKASLNRDRIEIENRGGTVEVIQEFGEPGQGGMRYRCMINVRGKRYSSDVAGHQGKPMTFKAPGQALRIAIDNWRLKIPVQRSWMPLEELIERLERSDAPIDPEVWRKLGRRPQKLTA